MNMLYTHAYSTHTSNKQIFVNCQTKLQQIIYSVMGINLFAQITSIQHYTSQYSIAEHSAIVVFRFAIHSKCSFLSFLFLLQFFTKLDLLFSSSFSPRLFLCVSSICSFYFQQTTAKCKQMCEQRANTNTLERGAKKNLKEKKQHNEQSINNCCTETRQTNETPERERASIIK